MTDLSPAALLLLAEDPAAGLPSPLPSSLLLSSLLSPPPSVPVTALLSSILTLLSRSPPSPSLSSLLSSLLLSSLSLLRTGNFTSPNPNPLLLFVPLLPLLPHPLPPSILAAATADLASVSSPDDALPLDLLPHLLALDPAAINPTIDNLLSADWSKALLIKITALLREFPNQARPRLPCLLAKVFDGMATLDIQDLPSIVYQLLVLASRGVCRREVLKRLLGFFDGTVLKGPGSIVRQVEGTVLMHVNFVVKQDPALGNEVIGIVKVDFGMVNRFAVAVVLSIARIRRFGEGAVGVLKQVVVSSQKDYKVSR